MPTAQGSPGGGALGPAIAGPALGGGAVPDHHVDRRGLNARTPRGIPGRSLQLLESAAIRSRVALQQSPLSSRVGEDREDRRACASARLLRIDYGSTSLRSPGHPWPITGASPADHRGTCRRSPNDERASTGERSQAGTGAAGNARSAMRTRDRIAEGASLEQRKGRAATWCPRRCREPAASPTGRAVPVAAMPRSGAARWRVAA